MMQRFEGSTVILIQISVFGEILQRKIEKKVYEQDSGKYLFYGCLLQNAGGKPS